MPVPNSFTHPLRTTCAGWRCDAKHCLRDHCGIPRKGSVFRIPLWAALIPLLLGNVAHSNAKGFRFSDIYYSIDIGVVEQEFRRIRALPENFDESASSIRDAAALVGFSAGAYLPLSGGGGVSWGITAELKLKISGQFAWARFEDFAGTTSIRTLFQHRLNLFTTDLPIYLTAAFGLLADKSSKRRAPLGLALGIGLKPRLGVFTEIGDSYFQLLPGAMIRFDWRLSRSWILGLQLSVDLSHYAEDLAFEGPVYAWQEVRQMSLSIFLK